MNDVKYIVHGTLHLWTHQTSALIRKGLFPVYFTVCGWDVLSTGVSSIQGFGFS